MLHLRYFSQAINKEAKEVYWFSLINSLAVALVFIFEPIFLYSLGYTPIQIMWFYVMVYCWYILWVIFGAKFAAAFGYKHAMLVSSMFYIVYWLLLFWTRFHPALFFIAPLFYALQKSFFWPAYDADIALAQQKAQRGRESGLWLSLIQMGYILGPLAGGIISKNFGFGFLFITAAVLLLGSNIPLFLTKDIYSRHSFVWRDLVAVFKNKTQNFFGYWGYAEDLMIMSLWPIYMFLVVPDLQNIGLISTVATVVGIVLMLYIGRVTDKMKNENFLSVTAIIYGVTWFFRFLAHDIASVLTFDSLTRASKDVANVSLNSLSFKNAGSGSPDHALAYGVFWEFSLSVGKILTALAAIAILSATGNIFLVFMLAGILTMFYGLLK